MFKIPGLETVRELSHGYIESVKRDTVLSVRIWSLIKEIMIWCEALEDEDKQNGNGQDKFKKTKQDLHYISSG